MEFTFNVDFQQFFLHSLLSEPGLALTNMSKALSLRLSLKVRNGMQLRSGGKQNFFFCTAFTSTFNPIQTSLVAYKSGLLDS